MNSGGGLAESNVARGKALSVIAVAALGLLAAIAGCEPKVASSVNPDGIVWGKPVDGLQAGLAANGASGASASVVELTLYQRNVGSAPLRVLEMSRRPYYLDYFGYEVEADGRRLESDLPSYAQEDPPLSAYIRIEPGKDDSATVEWRPDAWGLRPPFEADLTCIVRNDRAEIQAWDPKAKRNVPVTGLWVGEARTGTVRIAIGRDWRRVGLVTVAVAAGIAACCLVLLRAARKRWRAGGKG